MAADNKIPTSKPAVIFVRHGKTALNNDDDSSKDRIRGWKDIPLSKEGIEEVRKTSQRLKSTPIDEIYASDLSRAKRSAQIINQFHDAKLEIDKRLRPWGLGVFEGKVTKDVLPKIEKYIRNEDRTPEGGESFKKFRIGALLAVIDIIKESIKKKKYCAIVTHYRDLKLVQAWIANGMPKDLSVSVDVMLTKGHDTAEIYTFPLDKYES